MALSLLAVTCSTEATPPAAPSSAASPPVRAGVPFDVGDVVRQVQLAFRPEGRAFRGGTASYTVLASERGGVHLELRPATRRAQPSSLDLETVRIDRGAGLASARLRSVASDARAELDLDRGVAVEHLRNTDEGLAQSWRFAAAPPGGGNLTIRLRVSGQTFAGETATGLHFVDRTTGLGVRYGHATWIDAAGARTRVPAQLVGAAIELQVPSRVVDQSSYPAVLDPIVSPELGLDQPYVPTPGYNSTPDVASNGIDYLAVWAFGGTVRAARVSAGGVLLDPLGFQVSPNECSYDLSCRCNLCQPIDAFQPVVAWDGAAYLVAWEKIDQTSATTVRSIAGARVTTDGMVRDPLAISQVAGARTGPALAVRGAETLVVWQDDRNSATTGLDLYGARIAAGGGVIDAADLPISTAAGDQSRPALASNGTGYFVAWMDTRNNAISGLDLYAVAVGGDGVPVGAELALSTAADAQVFPAVASDGTGYFVVWEDGRNRATNGFDLYGARVDSGGNLLDAAGIPLVTTAAAQFLPDLAWDGTSYLLAWRDGTDIYAARMGTDGSLIDPNGFVVSAAPNLQTMPKLAISATGALVVWADDRAGAGLTNIYGARIAAGSVLDPNGIAVSLATHFETAPAVASNGTDFLVAWEDTRGSYGAWWGPLTDIYGTRVDAAGTVLDPLGLAISTASSSQRHPKIASNGTDYLVTWYDYRRAGDPQPSDVGGPPQPSDIYAARVTAAGAVLDPDGIPVATAAPETKVVPAVASNGTDYLITWFDYYSSAAQSCITCGARVDAAGAVLDPTPIAISTTTGGQLAMAWDGIDYVAAWQWSTSAVYGARISAAGTVLDPNAITIAPAQTSSAYGPPAVAAGGGSVLVAWEDLRRGEYDIFGARLDVNGVVLDPGGIALSTAPGEQHYPALSWSGAAYLLVWQDQPSSGVYDIAGTYVSAGGSVLYPEGFTISAKPTQELFPAVASVPGRSLVAYQATATRLIQARFVSPDTCQRDSDCSGAPVCMLAVCQGGVCAHQFATDGTACAGGVCSGGICSPEPDAAPPDAAPPDAAPPDAAPPDAAVPDAAPPDAAADASIDAAPAPDGPRPADASAAHDAAAADASTIGEPDGGCSCHVARRDSPRGMLVVTVAVGLLFVKRRRRRDR